MVLPGTTYVYRNIEIIDLLLKILLRPWSYLDFQQVRPGLNRIFKRRSIISMFRYTYVVPGYQKNVVYTSLTFAFSGASRGGLRIARQFWSCLEFFPAGGPVAVVHFLKKSLSFTI